MSDDALLRRTYQHLSEAGLSQDAQMVALYLLPTLGYTRYVPVRPVLISSELGAAPLAVRDALVELEAAGILQSGEMLGDYITYRIRHPAWAEMERRGWRVVGRG